MMELCKENLMRHIFLNPMNIPGRTSVSTRSAYRNTIQWAKDIASALEFIHCQTIVHRDLKLENILVRCINKISRIWCFGVLTLCSDGPSSWRACTRLRAASDRLRIRI